MPSKQKLSAKAVNNPRGLRFAEFTSLIEAFGFLLDRQRGSHRLYARPDVREFVNVQPSDDGRAKVAQVVEFLKLVERYGLRLESDS